MLVYNTIYMDMMCNHTNYDLTVTILWKFEEHMRNGI